MKVQAMGGKAAERREQAFVVGLPKRASEEGNIANVGDAAGSVEGDKDTGPGGEWGRGMGAGQVDNAPARNSNGMHRMVRGSKKKTECTISESVHKCAEGSCPATQYAHHQPPPMHSPFAALVSVATAGSKPSPPSLSPFCSPSSAGFCPSSSSSAHLSF